MRQRAGLASGHLQKSRGEERARARVKRVNVKENKGVKEHEQESRIWYTQDSLQGRTRVAWLKNTFLVKEGKNLPIADCKGSLAMEPETVRSKCFE